ncbi:hypothetical protein [Glutamicibacter ardleyensis]|uniref:hypothetical protein n=1 Tax=Glutamicibacter ardleyensis TaxID=225894 RepID=UPI003FD27AAF
MTRYRRDHSSVENPQPIGWRVKGANKQHIIGMAQAAQMSAAEFFDLMVENLELDDRGLPEWIPRDEDEGQLPIDQP